MVTSNRLHLVGCLHLSIWLLAVQIIQERQAVGVLGGTAFFLFAGSPLAQGLTLFELRLNDLAQRPAILEIT
jgi:hypothetical protein